MESSHRRKIWHSKALEFCRRIKQAIGAGVINQKQCFVLRLLADCIERYRESWINISHPQLESDRTAKLGKELLTILENGLRLINLCDEKDSPAQVFTILGCKGQLSEIIDDARIYIQMINRLILKSLPDTDKHLDIEKLMLQVESDCRGLQYSLELAFEEDRKTLLIHNSNIHFLLWCLSSKPNPAISSLLQMLKAETEPNILDSDLPVNQKLGEGSSGDVHSAVWLKLPVAVKTFKSSEDLKKELDIFKKLLHNNSPHIVQMLGHTGGNKLVLELMEKDLERYMMTTNSGLTLIQSIDLMLQIAKPMRHLHSIGLVHRDLKPSNVLVNPGKDKILIKLADFGIAKDNFDTANTNTDLKGTVMYMAPEVLEARTQVTRKIDVYSFGLICAEILSWSIRPPKNLAEMLKLTKKGEGRPKLPRYVPEKLRSLIQSCMEYNEEKRPSFADICHDLWLVKEEALIDEVNSLAVEVKITIRGLEGIQVEKVAIASAIHPPLYVQPPLYPEPNSQLAVSHRHWPSPVEIVVSNIVHPPLYSAPASKRAFCVFDQADVYRKRYSMKDLPIDIITDIMLYNVLDVEPSGKVKILDPWTTLYNPFVGMGVDPQNQQGEEPPPEDRGLFGQYKKLLRDQGKKFNLSLWIGFYDTSSLKFSAAFSSEGTRAAFIDSLMELLRKYPLFNGLVIDWNINSSDVDNLVLVLEALRNELPVASFMIALTCTPFADRQWPIEKAIRLLDRIHIIMAIPQKDFTSHYGNLYHSAYSKYSIHESVQMYLFHKIPSSKIIIGAMLAGLKFSDTDGMGTPACEVNLDDGYKRLYASQEKWDDEAKAAYIHDPIAKVVYTYDSVRSVIEKAKYVKENDLGGIAICAAGYDFPPDHERSIVKALHDHFSQ